MRRLLLVLACVSIAAPAYAKHKKVVKKPKAVKVATKQADPDGVVADATSVYWTNTDHAIVKVPIGGGKPTVLVDGAQSVATFAVDGTNVYWIDFDGNVKSMPLAGGDPTTLATGQKGGQFLTTDGKLLCWSIYGEKGAIVTVPVAGGKPSTLASDEWPAGPAIAGDVVFWARNDGALRSAPSKGGATTNAATGGTHPGGIVADSHAVYWTVGNDDGAIMSLPLAGGTATTVAAKQAMPMFIAVDANNLYWVDMGQDTSTERSNDGNDGTVIEVPLAGGSPKTLASKLGAPSGLAQDATHLYVSDQRTGIIWSIPK